MDVRALPGDREGQREAGCFLPLPLPPPLGLLCCFCAKVSQALPVPLCVLPVSSSRLPLPHRLPKELKCQLRIWGQSV